MEGSKRKVQEEGGGGKMSESERGVATEKRWRGRTADKESNGQRKRKSAMI